MNFEIYSEKKVSLFTFEEFGLVLLKLSRVLFCKQLGQESSIKLTFDLKFFNYPKQKGP